MLLKKKEKLGYLMMAATINIVFSFKNVYYLIFLTNVLEIDIAIAGIITAVGTIWDAINDPILGVFVANHKFKSGEKVRPLLLRASVPWGITLVLLFFNFNVDKTWTIVICLILYFVFETIYTLVSIPYTAMTSLATNNEEDRKKISALRGLGAGIGSGIGALTITPLIKAFGGLSGKDAIIGKNDAQAILLTAIVMGSLCIAGALFHYFTSKERISSAPQQNEKISIIKSYKMLGKSKSWRLNTTYFLLYGLNNVLTMTTIAYYASYVLKSSSMATIILAGYIAMYFVGALFSPIIDKKLGRKKAMLISLLIQLIGKIPFFIVPNNLITVILNAATFGFGGSFVFVLSNTNRATIADIASLKCGRRVDSIVSSCENLLLKLLEAFGQWVITFSLALAGFNSQLGPDQPQSAIYVIYAFIGLVPFIISGFSIFVVRKLDAKKEYDELKTKNDDNNKKPNFIIYHFARLISLFINRFKINNRFTRNDLKKIKGSALVLCNHVSSYDQCIVIGATKKRMHFVVADSTYYSKFNFLLRKIGIISKQQFFTNIHELKAMKRVIDANGILTIFPCGLCTSDGLSTTLPIGVANFLKFLNTDVYVIKSHGMYLTNPKWSKGIRKGRVETEAYRLFSKDELNKIPSKKLFSIIDNAMKYDEYSDQAKMKIIRKNASIAQGLQNVLYSCPKCFSHFSIDNINNKLVCKKCGFEANLDKYGFILTNPISDIKYVYTWHQLLIDNIKNTINNSLDFLYQFSAIVKILDKHRHKFVEISHALISIDINNIMIKLDNGKIIYKIPTSHFFSLPMIPGKYFDLQDGINIYRCFPDEIKNVSYMTDIVIALYQLRNVI